MVEEAKRETIEHVDEAQRGLATSCGVQNEHEDLSSKTDQKHSYLEIFFVFPDSMRHLHLLHLLIPTH